MRSFFLILFFGPIVGCWSTALGQSTTREVFSSGGWNAEGEVSLTATLGQWMAGINYAQSGQLRQGFQQPIQYQEPIEGCLDLEACNYNAAAAVDDDSCDYVSCLIGCMEPDACNFDPSVIADDGSCDYCKNNGTYPFSHLRCRLYTSILFICTLCPIA